jgi:Sec-independent protein secretion pathway components
MFGIGLSELLVIGCVVIIFVRPKDLPILFKRLGRMYARLRSLYDEITSAKNGIIHDLESELAPNDDPVKKSADEEAAYSPYAKLEQCEKSRASDAPQKASQPDDEGDSKAP